MSGEAPCCATCEHWSNVEAAIATAERRPHGADQTLGICRRFPPVIVEHRGGYSSRFPETFGARLCGDWSAIFDPDDGGGPDDGERVLNLAAERARRAA